MLKTSSKNLAQVKWSEATEILSTYAGMDSTGWKLGVIDSLDSPEFQDAINKLASEVLVPNPFFELPVLKAAIKNLGGSDVKFLYLSKTSSTKETLKFFAPVILAPIGIFRKKVLRTWNHVYSPLGMPLVSKHDNQETCKAFIECIKTVNYKDAKAIVFEDVAKEGSFINALYRSQHVSDKLLLSSGTPRAGLKPVKNLNYENTYFSGKRKQRLRKARRELDTLGDIEYHDFDTLDDIDQQLENFLKLEEMGWKGKRKTALKNSKSSAAFCKEAVRNAITNEKCHINSITLNGKTIASLITYKSNRYFYPWKITFDENYAQYSVGNLLTTFATSLFASRECFKGLDSLAAEHNETTLRFWPDEKEFFTMTIGIGKDATQTVLSITDELNRIKRIKKTLRAFLKEHPYLERLVSSLRI